MYLKKRRLFDRQLLQSSMVRKDGLLTKQAHCKSLCFTQLFIGWVSCVLLVIVL